MAKILLPPWPDSSYTTVLDPRVIRVIRKQQKFIWLVFRGNAPVLYFDSWEHAMEFAAEETETIREALKRKTSLEFQVGRLNRKHELNVR